MNAARPREPLRAHTYRILEGAHGGGLVGTIVEVALIMLIVGNVIAYTLQSVPWIEREFRAQFDAFEAVSVLVFTIEYAFRIWAAPEDPLCPRGGPLLSRLRYALRPMLLIDFLAIAPAYVTIFVPFIDLRVLRLIRLLRLLKIARYSPALATLGHVIHEERRALVGTLLLMLCTIVFAAAVMHAVEGSVQPQKFGTIPDAMWWAVTTLTTVGYGDAVPVTVFGRFVAGMTMIVGLGLFALPVGIVATGFVNTIHRRDFNVTFGMLARVPLFQGMRATVLSEIMDLLRARVVPPGTIVSARGEPAEAMYFVVSGELEVELATRHMKFGAGEFFGELNLLRKTMQSATVVSITQCRILTLSATDFTHLRAKHPNVDQGVREKARRLIQTFADADEAAQSELQAAGYWREESAPHTAATI